jgi:hypothetical protein
MLQRALALYDQGILSLPSANAPADKVPLCKYAHWRGPDAKIPSRESFERIWRQFPNAGMQIMCENGTEVVELEKKHEAFGQDIIGDFERELEKLCPGLLARLYIETSRSGGRHYIYRTELGTVSADLAKRPAEAYELEKKPHKFYLLSEILAHMSLCYVAPSPGYTTLQGDLLNLPHITEDERRFLISAAISLNTYVEKNDVPASFGGNRPGDQYSAEVPISEVLDMLQSDGWRVTSSLNHTYIKLNRPDAKNKLGTDATINTVERWFYLWSNSEGFIKPGASTFFSLYVHLRHRGNFTEATKALVAKGYGQPARAQTNVPLAAPGVAASTPFTPTKIPQPGNDGLSKKTDWLSERASRKFSFTREWGNVRWMLYRENPGNRDNPFQIGAQGQLVVFSGLKKSFKTQVLASAVSAALSDGVPNPLGFMWDLPEDLCHIKWFDTEQGELYFKETLERVHWMADKAEDLGIFDAYSLKKYGHAERMQIIREEIVADPKTGVIIIDGGLDLLVDYNNQTQVSTVDQFLSELTDAGILVLMVLHTSDSFPNKLMGSFGSQVARKLDARFHSSISNPSEDSDLFREVRVRQIEGRGLSSPPFDIMSYQKMAYVKTTGVPAHFRKHFEGGRRAKAVSQEIVQQTDRMLGEVTEPRWEATAVTRPARMQDEDIPF